MSQQTAGELGSRYGGCDGMDLVRVRDTVSATMSPNFVVHGNTGPAKPCLSEAQHVQLWMQIQQVMESFQVLCN